MHKSRLLRTLTLLVSGSLLALLVVQASLTSGCGGAESSQTKPADPTTNPPASPNGSATQEIDVGPPQMGGSKSGAILWPEKRKNEVQAKPLNAPASNLNAQR